MLSKEELTNNISNLKKEVQNLIDYKKNNLKNLSKEDIEDINNKKTKYIEDISNYTSLLKDIVKKEKEKNSLINNIKKAQNANDSFNYYIAKRYGKIEELEKLKENKEIRENVRQEYLYYLTLEENFYKLDCPDLPGILFLHQDILNNYGLCPFIINDLDLINIDELNLEQETKNIKENRKKWLENTHDKGTIYYNLFDNIFMEKETNDFNLSLNKLDKNIENIIENFLTNSQYKIYKDSLLIIDEYNNCNIKTKKIKEKYKLLIHNLSILYSETNLPIDKFLELKYSLSLPINLIPGSKDEFKNESKNNDLFIIKNFEEDLLDYQACLEKINQKVKYISNIKKNLKQDFHDFLMKKSNFSTTKKKVKTVQEGKYFKNWSNLTIDEKYERLESFSNHYTIKFLEENSEIELSNEIILDQLIKLLKENLDNKNLNCKDLSWKSNKGFIEKIKILKFNHDNGLFYLEKEVKPPTPNNKESNLQKSLSKKTILNKVNEKTINEEMLTFILKHNQKNDSNITENIDEFIDKLKSKLKLKKISKDDRSNIINKLVDMNDIIKNHPSI